MKEPRRFSSSRPRVLFLALGLLLLLMAQACSTYSPSHGYPPSTYAYPPQGIAYYPSHGYYSHRHYGSYPPGWFISSGYSGAYYGNWVYAPLAYWPSHSHYYYRHAFYPYYDPWYYSYTRRYRSPYGYRYGYGSGSGYAYGYGNPYGGHPYYGYSQTYRPPGQNQPPTQSRPDPVVIPPGQRGRSGASEDFNEQIDRGLRQRETYQPDRRAVTVVNEEQGLSRSVGVAPTQAGDQGMTISNRSERKIRESRLEPVGTQAIVVQPGAVQNDRQSAYGNVAEQPPTQQPTQPTTQPTNPAIPAGSGRRSRSYESPARGYQPPPDTAERMAPPAQYRPPSRQIAVPAASMATPPESVESEYRQAPARQQPANRQPYQQQPPRNEPAYQRGPASGEFTPEPDRRQPPDAEGEREEQNY